jgi:hypothetical protein
MNWIEVIAWRQTFDPHGRMSELQRMIVESALKRGDTRTAKIHLRDWKLIP